MTRRIVLAGLVVAVLGFGGLAPAAAADTVESVERELTKQWNKVRSMSATMVIKSDMKHGGGSTTMDSSGTYEYQKVGDKVIFRMEMKSTTVSRYGEQETKMESAVTSVNDGEYLYTLSEQMGQKTAMKMKASTPPSLDVKSMFETMRQNNVLKLLPEQSLDGQAVYVIEATAKDSSSAMAKTMMYFAKDSGVMLKSVSHDSQERVIQNTMYRDVKINESIAPDRFVFKTPAGVTMMDMTNP